MKIPLQISFSNMTASDAVRARIEELAGRLDRFHDRIMSCRVVVSASTRRQRSGRIYHVSIDLKLPGHEIAINRGPAEDHAHEDVYVAIRDAFDAAVRRIEDVSRKQRGDIKTHEEEPSGVVVRLFPEENYGFIEDKSAGEVYFHAHSVPNDEFRKLKVGSTVRYRTEAGDKGLQATVVKPIGSLDR
jgi:ribosomal subunit interface protein